MGSERGAWEDRHRHLHCTRSSNEFSVNAFLAPYSLTPFDCSFCMLYKTLCPSAGLQHLHSEDCCPVALVEPFLWWAVRIEWTRKCDHPRQPLVPGSVHTRTTLLTTQCCYSFISSASFTRSDLNSCQTVFAASFHLPSSTAYFLSILLAIFVTTFCH